MGNPFKGSSRNRGAKGPRSLLDQGDLEVFSREVRERITSQNPIIRSFNEAHETIQCLNLAIKISYAVLAEKKQEMENTQRDTLYTCQQEIEKLEDQSRHRTNAYETKIENLKQIYGNQINRKDTEIARLNRDLNSANVRLDAQKRQAEENCRALDTMHRAKMVEDEKKWAVEVRGLIDKHDKRIDEMRSKFASDMKDRDDKLNSMHAEFEKTMAKLIHDHDEDMNSKSRAFAESEERLIAAHKSRVNYLKGEVDGLNGVLMSRDNDCLIAPSLSDLDNDLGTDERIKTRLSDVLQAVDDLSRLNWKPQQDFWTYDILQMVRGEKTLRMLKKIILQDIVWTILYRRIFYSPFRVLGTEGGTLEQQWKELFGQNRSTIAFDWPEPDLNAERWRYRTIRECRKALMEPASEWDPRARLRKSYRTTLELLIKELQSKLADMTEANETHFQEVSRLAKKASNVWLELGMHRCRYVMFMCDEEVSILSDAEKARKALEGTPVLTIVPGLRRHGNARGLDLDKTSIVGNLEGQWAHLSRNET